MKTWLDRRLAGQLGGRGARGPADPGLETPGHDGPTHPGAPMRNVTPSGAAIGLGPGRLGAGRLGGGSGAGGSGGLGMRPGGFGGPLRLPEPEDDDDDSETVVHDRRKLSAAFEDAEDPATVMRPRGKSVRNLATPSTADPATVNLGRMPASFLEAVMRPDYADEPGSDEGLLGYDREPPGRMPAAERSSTTLRQRAGSPPQSLAPHLGGDRGWDPHEDHAPSRANVVLPVLGGAFGGIVIVAIVVAAAVAGVVVA
ncbi:MAG: hypothetical protein ABMB14_24360, partial [Myxococcota bacterium]